jgi:hypothetical protein
MRSSFCASPRLPSRFAAWIELEFDMTNYSAEAFGALASQSNLTVLVAYAGYDDALYAFPGPPRSSLRSV